MQQYLSASDKSEYAFLRTAQLLKRFELFDEAEKTYLELTRAFPDSNAAQEAYAAFLYDREKKDDAIAIWRKLAKGKQRGDLIHIARVLAARNEHEVALELLDARKDEFANDAVFLGQLVLEKIALKKFEDALPFARRRVQLAQTPSDLEIAMSQFAQVSKKAEQTGALIKSLTEAPHRSIQDTCLLAELLERSDDRAGADRLLAELEEEKSLLVTSQQIRLYSQRHDWTRAAEATRRLVDMPEGRKSVHVRQLVELYQKDYKINDALKWVQEWKKLSPGSTLPWLTESRLLTQQGKNKEAISALRVAVQEFEDNQELRTRLAQLYIDAGHNNDAERIYWRQYEESKDLIGKLRAVQNLAEIAEITEQLVERFEERRRTNRKSIEPLLALAEIHRVSGNYEGRRKALVEATRLKADDLQLLHEIARIEESEGDWEKAMATLERAVKLDKTTRSREKMARLHLNNGNLDEGYEILYELAGARTADPRNAEAIAEAMMSAQDWETAIKFLTESVSQFPDDYRLRYLQAIALEEEDRTSEAIDGFMEMLRIDKEISTPYPNAPRTPWAGYSLSDLLPQESMDYMEFGWLTQQAYSHRQQRGRYVSAYRGLPQAGITMPQDLKAARKYALSHVITMAQSMDEEEVDDLSASAKDHGVDNFKLLMELGSSRSQRPEQLLELVEEYPEDEGLMALYLLMTIQGSPDPDGSFTVKGFEMFKETRPQLAMIAAVQAGTAGKDHLPVMKKALKTAAEIDNPNLFMLMSVASALGGGFTGNGGVDDSFPADLKTQLEKQLVDWYPKMSRRGPQTDMVFYVVVNTLASAKDPALYLKFLEDEVGRWRNSGRKSSGQGMGIWYGGNEVFFQAIGFPPDKLSDFPPHVRVVISNPEQSYYGQFQPPTWEPEEIVKNLKAVKDPTLKILLALAWEQDELAKQTLESMLNAEQPSLDAYILAAGKATADEDFKSAAELLDKSRYLPMTRDMRKRVDAALVEMAVEDVQSSEAESEESNPDAGLSGIQKALAALRRAAGANAEEEDSSITTVGRQAALRLRRSSLPADQRLQLIAKLEDLGLSEEAKKLENTTPAVGVAGSYGRGISSPVANSTDRITKLLGEGKEDQALKALEKDLNSLARSALADISNFRNNRYGRRQLTGLIQSHGLVDKLLKKMDPGESTGIKKLSQFAIVCDMLGKTDRAKSAYEKVLAKRDKNDAIRLRMFMLTIADDQDAAVEHLKMIDSRSDQIGWILSELVSDYDLSFRKKLNIVQAVDQYLNSLKNTDKIDLSWVEQVVSSLAVVSNRNQTMPSLYMAPDPELLAAYDLKGSALENFKLRRKVYDQLCRTMLTIPQLAPDGFTSLLAAAEADGKIDDEFVELALNAIKQYKPMKSPINPYRSVSSNIFSLNNVEQNVPFRTPEEFLVRHAWKTQNLKLIDEQVVPILMASKDSKEKEAKEKTELIKKMLGLYICPESEFLKLAKDFLGDDQKQSRSPYGIPDDGTISKIVEIWDERDLKADVGDILLKRVASRINSGGYYYSQYPYLIRYASVLAKRGQRQVITDFLEKLTELFLGPKEKRKEYVKKHYNINNRRNPGNNAKIQGYIQLMQGFMQKRQLAFPIINTMEESGLLSRNNQISYQINNLISQTRNGDVYVDELVEFLDSSPFLGELDEIRFYSTPSSRQPTIIGNVYASLKQYGGEDRTRLLAEKLESRKEFGAQLLTTYLKDDSSNLAGVLEFLAKHQSQLREQPEEKQKQIAGLIETLSNNYGEHKELSKAAKQMQAWLKKISSGGKAALIKKVQEAKRFTDLKVNEHEIVNQISEVIGSLIHTDESKAKEIYIKIVDLHDDHVKRNKRRSAQMRAYGNNSFASQVVYQVAAQHHSFPSLAFVLDTMLHEDKRYRPDASQVYNLILNFNTLLSVSQQHVAYRHDPFYGQPDLFEDDALETEVETVEEPEKKKESPLERVKTIYQGLGEHVGQRPITALAGPLFDGFSGLNIERLDEIIQWADGQAADGDYPVIAGEIATAAKLAKGNKRTTPAVPTPPTPKTASANEPKANETGESKPIEMKEYHQHYLSVMENKELPLIWRIAVAQTASNRTHAVAVPKPFMFAIVRLMEESYGDEKSGLDNGMSSYVLTSLLTVERDEAWKESATALATAWNKRFGSRASPNQPYYGYYGAGSLVSILKLNLLLENESQVSQLLRKYEQHLVGSEAAFALLVQHNRHSMAAKHLRSGWSKMRLNEYGYDAYGNTHQTEYDQKLHQSIPKFLETLKKKDLRYLAEVILVTLPDTKDEESKPALGHEERLVKVAEKFDTIEFEGPAIKEKTLVWLSNSDNKEVLEKISDSIAEIAKTIDLGAVMQLDNHQLQQRKRVLFMAYLTSQLQDGNFQPVIEALDRLENSDVDYDYQIQEAISAIGERVSKVIYENVSDWDAEKLAAVLPTMRRFASMENFNYRYRYQNFPGLNIALHILAGQTEQLSQWMKDLPEEQRSVPTAGIWKIAAKLVQKKPKSKEAEVADRVTANSQDTLSKRLAMAKDIFKFFQSQNAAGWLDLNQFVIHSGDNQGLVNSLIHSRLLSQEELLEHGPSIAADAPLDGLMWAALAEVQQRVSKTDAAVKSYTKAIASTPDEKSLQLARLHMNQARLFSKYLKQPAKARTLLEGFDKEKLKKLDKSDQKEFDDLLKEMKNSR